MAGVGSAPCRATVAEDIRNLQSRARHARRVSQVLLGHAKLDTPALYTRVATKTISEVMSPLERIAIKLKEIRPPT